MVKLFVVFCLVPGPKFMWSLRGTLNAGSNARLEMSGRAPRSHHGSTVAPPLCPFQKAFSDEFLCASLNCLSLSQLFVYLHTF